MRIGGLALAALCGACAEAPPPLPVAQAPAYESCQEKAQSMTDALLAGRDEPGTSTIESDGDNWRIHYAGSGENHSGALTFYVEKRRCQVVRTVVE
ncbi:MAG TPA: hypothetical protein VF798_14205 [Burkholderiaceae bacterium]